MRLVAEHMTESQDGHYSRIVRQYTGGVREVLRSHHGESWTRYIIIPRRLILNEIRKLRKLGCKVVGNWNFWELLPEGASELIRCEYYSGPGQSFAHRPCKVRSRSRKYVVIYQSGGIDI